MQLFCDDLAVVQVLQTSKARDDILTMFACNIWLLTTIYNIHLSLSVVHIPRKNNALAELLSRWNVTKHNYMVL